MESQVSEGETNQNWVHLSVTPVCVGIEPDAVGVVVIAFVRVVGVSGRLTQ
jgi:hypothetical protein